MNWGVLTVPRSGLRPVLEAIRSGGGTVTATKLAGDDIAITYVTDDEVRLRKECARRG